MVTTSNLLSPLTGVARLLLALALFDGTAGAQVPVVFKVSEGVRPNAIVSLYGEYLTGTPTVRFLKSDGTVAATQTSVQTDRGGHFCRVVFPAILPGAYRLAVSNGAGWSTQTIYVNRADPRWISEERAYSGPSAETHRPESGRVGIWRHPEHAGASGADRRRQGGGHHAGRRQSVLRRLLRALGRCRRQLLRGSQRQFRRVRQGLGAAE